MFEYNQRMGINSFEIRLCQNCGLRYPLTEEHPFGDRCPICLGTTLRVLSRQSAREPIPSVKKIGFNLEALLDNIRSIWNVGSIFRTSDGLGISKLYLCGITPTPENEVMHKTSLGAEETVTWEYSRNALDTAKKLKIDGRFLIAMEQDERAESIESFHALSDKKVTLILGNEVTGVDPELLDLCDHILYLPMHGQKRSLNVEVAFAIAAYAIRSHLGEVK